MQSTPTRGGRRAGAGRRPTVAERPTSVVSFTLDEATLAKITRWHQDPRNHAASRSEALRQMVDLADRRRSAVRQYRWRQTVQTSAQT